MLKHQTLSESLFILKLNYTRKTATKNSAVKKNKFNFSKSSEIFDKRVEQTLNR